MFRVYAESGNPHHFLLESEVVKQFGLRRYDRYNANRDLRNVDLPVHHIRHAPCHLFKSLKIEQDKKAKKDIDREKCMGVQGLIGAVAEQVAENDIE
jgi:hypothetical protein